MYCNYSDLDCDIFPIPKESDDRQEYFLKKATQLAFRSNMGQRHGCIVVDSQTDEIISTGYNHTAIHLYHKWSCHAEIDALRKIKRSVDLSNAELYVVRIGTEGMGNPLKMSKPCEGCSKAILKSGIKKTYYSWSPIDQMSRTKKK
jgi:deoxycytidylate deaminase